VSKQSRLGAVAAAAFAAYAAGLFLGQGSDWSQWFASAVNCLLPLLANVGLLLNTHTPYRRRNLFWVYLALSCLLWAVGALILTWSLRMGPREMPHRLADLAFFLFPLPILAAVWIRPDRRKLGTKLRQGRLDALLLLAWWGYVYAFWVAPPAWLLPYPAVYQRRYLEVTGVEIIVVLLAVTVVWRSAAGEWRRVYGHLFGATALILTGWSWLRLQMARQGGGFHGFAALLPVAGFLWLGLAGLDARGRELMPAEGGRLLASPRSAARLAMAGILSMPLLGAWSAFASTAPQPVRHYRLVTTFIAILIGLLFLTLRQSRMDRMRRNLMVAIRESLDSTHRLQVDLAHADKLAQLGELAGAAAQAIQNPLQGILGYVELLLENPQAGEPVRALAMKIRSQAHRVRALVNHLLMFARHVPMERSLIDVNELLSGTALLRQAELAGRGVQVKMDLAPGLPPVRGDRQQLLQVFSELISNAAEAMQPSGGRLEITTRRDGDSVVVEFADTGPGIKNPERVFDPFFTTKTVGHGAGLGLSMCFGIVREHGGAISCGNRPGGGAMFRVELPAVLVPVSLQTVLQTVERVS
jgi:signal transduction histidine kinase